jgi:BASS family bile acid:Na+ symporter
MKFILKQVPKDDLKKMSLTTTNEVSLRILNLCKIIYANEYAKMEAIKKQNEYAERILFLVCAQAMTMSFNKTPGISWKDFAAVAQSPKSVAIGISAQFAIMPLIGFGLAKLSGLEPEVAAGIILVGCAPGGTASNVMAFLARANVALSVTLTTITTLLAPFMMPVLMKLLAGQFIEIDLLKMMWDIFKIILLPVGAGLLVHQMLGKNSGWIEKLLPLVSMLGIALIILVITAAGRDSLLAIGPILILLFFLHNVMGYGVGYVLARTMRMGEQDARTIAIEVGMQNAGLASGLSNIMGKITTLGLAPAVFGPMQNITGSILATFWSRKTVDQK